MLKEARIVMPITGHGSPHDSMRRSLVNAFGGYTCTRGGTGDWADQGVTVEEDVLIYDVAIDDNVDNRSKLLHIALAAGKDLHQKAVYIRYPDGRVDIVDVEPKAIKPVPYEPALGGYTPGAKRLPQVGEVWRNRANALVGVMSAATVLDGGYNVVTLTKSEVARSPGHVYLVDLDGHVHRDHSGAPGDLVTFVTRFDR